MNPVATPVGDARRAAMNGASGWTMSNGSQAFEMAFHFLVSGLAVVALSSLGLVAMNASLVFRLRQNHPQLLESLGSPGILWTRNQVKDAGLRFVFSSARFAVGDPGLITICRTYRFIAVLHFAASAMCAITLLVFGINGFLG